MRTRTLATFALILLACLGGIAAAFLLVHTTIASAATGAGAFNTLLLAGVLVLLSAGTTWAVLRLTDRPVIRLRQSVRGALDGDYRASAASRIGSAGADMALLARDFDTMTTRVRRHLASRSRMLRGISQELRGPLSRLQAIVSLMRQHRGEDDALANRMERELSDLHSLVAEVLTYSQLETRNTLKRQRTNLSDLVRTIAEDAAAAGADGGTTVSLACGEDLYADVDHGLVYTALENLVQHALRRAPGGIVNIALAGGEQQTLELEILHHGLPVKEAATLDHLFDPFSPAPGGGSMSLAVAQRAIMLHGGTVEAVNTPKGLLVSVALPARER